jgi:hypothetical protein
MLWKQDNFCESLTPSLSLEDIMINPFLLPKDQSDNPSCSSRTTPPNPQHVTTHPKGRPRVESSKSFPLPMSRLREEEKASLSISVPSRWNDSSDAFLPTTPVRRRSLDACDLQAKVDLLVQQFCDYEEQED